MRSPKLKKKINQRINNKVTMSSWINSICMYIFFYQYTPWPFIRNAITMHKYKTVKYNKNTYSYRIRINLPLCYCILFKLKNLQLGMLILLRFSKTIILLWIKANVVNGLKFIFLVKIIFKKFKSIKKNHFKKSKLFKKAQYPNAWKEGGGDYSY